MILSFRSTSPNTATTQTSFESTGLPRLDAQLPGGGWPVGAVTELCATHADIGALSALTPTLVRLTQANRKVVLMAPDDLDAVEQLGEQGVRLRHVSVMRAHEANALWAMEQKLRSGDIAMLIAWVDGIDNRDVRRLEIAARAGNALVMLFRKAGATRYSRASALHLLLRPGTDGLLDIEVLKPRGLRSGTVTAQGTRNLPRSRPQRAYAPLAYRSA